VIEASELKKADIGVLGKGKSDPYCRITGGRTLIHSFILLENLCGTLLLSPTTVKKSALSSL